MVGGGGGKGRGAHRLVRAQPALVQRPAWLEYLATVREPAHVPDRHAALGLSRPQQHAHVIRAAQSVDGQRLAAIVQLQLVRLSTQCVIRLVVRLAPDTHWMHS